MDTIFAVASGRPPAAIAVLRISGALAVTAATALAGVLPPPRLAVRRTLRDEEERVLDDALVLVFATPASATGEDIVELHLHGGRAIIAAVEARLAAIPGLRRAEAGEFTRRALANGKIDLAQAEGLADLLEAETEQQRRVAQDMADGHVSRQVRGWMDRVSALSAATEARIEFEEEGDVARLGEDRVPTDCVMLAGEFDAALAAPPIERWRDGIRVAIVGPPNSGKSSLMNALAAREVAIVTATPGTTRDRIEAHVQRNGVGYVLIDTAGLRETADPIEVVGVELARRTLAAADIVLATGYLAEVPGRTIALRTKADLGGDLGVGQLPVSIFDAASIERLWLAVERVGTELLPSDHAIVLGSRQRTLLAGVRTELVAAGAIDDLLLRAEHLRRAGRGLSEIVGADATEEMLDALFARFCIGK